MIKLNSSLRNSREIIKYMERTKVAFGMWNREELLYREMGPEHLHLYHRELAATYFNTCSRRDELHALGVPFVPKIQHNLHTAKANRVNKLHNLIIVYVKSHRRYYDQLYSFSLIFPSTKRVTGCGKKCVFVLRNYVKTSCEIEKCYVPDFKIKERCWCERDADLEIIKY